VSAKAPPSRESESLNIQRLVDSIPPPIPTARRDGYLDHVNSQLGRHHRQIVDSGLLLDARFVLPTPAGAFSCRWLKGAACWSNLSTPARYMQRPGRRSRVLTATLGRTES
jgi:hypothetical protein